MRRHRTVVLDSGNRFEEDVAFVPKGYQKITALSTATALTVPDDAVLAIIIPATQNVRWRDDGTNPTATTGMPLNAGQSLEYDGDLAAIKFIEEEASAELHVSYYGFGGE